MSGVRNSGQPAWALAPVGLALAMLGCQAASVGKPVSVDESPGGGGSGGAAGLPVSPPPPGGSSGAAPCGPRIEGPATPCPDGQAPPPAAPDAGAPASPPAPGPGCPAEGPITVKVRAWGATPTCVYLRAGETAQITASGTWRMLGGDDVGPAGRGSTSGGCPRGALVARVAKFHQRTCIRDSGSITARRDGYLWLFQNQGWNAMQSGGEITATVTGGSRSDRWPEGMTPISLDSRIDEARIRAFESVCGPERIPVRFEAEDPDHPRVRDYVQRYFGGDPEAWISRAMVRGCALFYATPEEFPKHFKDRRVRVLHTVSVTQAWASRDRPPLRNARGEHWDFKLNKTLEEITSMQPDYGPFGGPPVSIMHEVGHLIAPDGATGTLPKWLGETYAETLPANIGDDRTGFHNAIDNPESIRFGATFWWCDGTFGGPPFVDWIDEQHPGFLHALTRASMALNGGPSGRVDGKVSWPGSETIFRQITGRSFDDLWGGFVEDYNFEEFRPGRPISECMDPAE